MPKDTAPHQGGGGKDSSPDGGNTPPAEKATDAEAFVTRMEQHLRLVALRGASFGDAGRD